ncbi:MAG: L-threonylcarbamoyladenylate synthase [bacterium]
MEKRLIIFNFNDKKETDRAVKKAAEVLKLGGIVVHPTDTCYGIAADITNQKAIEKVYLLKDRNQKKPLKIIVKDLNDFRKYGKYYPVVEKLIDKYAPFQISFVVSKSKTIPAFLNPWDKSIGIQIPRTYICQQLLEKANVPLVATSANISTKKECYNLIELFDQFLEKDYKQPPFLIIYGGQLPFKKTSSVVRVINNEKIKIIRSGDAGKIEV